MPAPSNNTVRALQTFISMAQDERRVFIEAAGFLIIARAAVAVVPFRWIARTVETHRDPPLRAGSLERGSSPRRVAEAVAVVARRSPIPLVCLPQALAVKWMLNRRRLASALHLGAANNKKAGFRAHAWITVNETVLIGGGGLSQYVEVARFE